VHAVFTQQHQNNGSSSNSNCGTRSRLSHSRHRAHNRGSWMPRTEYCSSWWFFSSSAKDLCNPRALSICSSDNFVLSYVRLRIRNHVISPWACGRAKLGYRRLAARVAPISASSARQNTRSRRSSPGCHLPGRHRSMSPCDVYTIRPLQAHAQATARAVVISLVPHPLSHWSCLVCAPLIAHFGLWRLTWAAAWACRRDRSWAENRCAASLPSAARGR